MGKKNFNIGIGLTALGSFWWGVIGVWIIFELTLGVIFSLKVSF